MRCCGSSEVRDVSRGQISQKPWKKITRVRHIIHWWHEKEQELYLFTIAFHLSYTSKHQPKDILCSLSLGCRKKWYFYPILSHSQKCLNSQILEGVKPFPFDLFNIISPFTSPSSFTPLPHHLGFVESFFFFIFMGSVFTAFKFKEIRSQGTRDHCSSWIILQRKPRTRKGFAINFNKWSRTPDKENIRSSHLVTND